MIDIFEDPHFQSLFECFDKLKFRKAQRILAAQIIQQTIDACTDSFFSFDKKKMFVFFTLLPE
jgi:PhoPQ-activated pathogenicity-related protein